MNNISAISRREQGTFDMMMMFAFLITGYFYSASSLKQESVCRHVTLMGHTILISSQSVFALMLHA
jgi:hypothetical protein